LPFNYTDKDLFWSFLPLASTRNLITLITI
jgi:hypothetical protein